MTKQTRLVALALLATATATATQSFTGAYWCDSDMDYQITSATTAEECWTGCAAYATAKADTLVAIDFLPGSTGECYCQNDCRCKNTGCFTAYGCQNILGELNVLLADSRAMPANDCTEAELAITGLKAFDVSLSAELNTMWVVLGAILVFFTQTGYAMLVVGSVDVKNTQNILLKNVLDASLGAVIWWTIGYGIAMGSSKTGIYGTDHFFLTLSAFSDGSGTAYASWLFHWAMAAVVAAVASGAMAERCTLFAHSVFACCLMGFIYPVVAQASWGSEGYASALLGSTDKDDYFRGCGVLDFGGSGVVHMTGGIAALMGCVVLGQRKSVADGSTKVAVYGPIFQTLGTLIVWLGWYGANAGGALIVGHAEVVAKTMVTTTLGAASGALGTLAFGSFKDSATSGKRVVKLEYANLGARAGLVAISAGCAVVEPWAACAIGASAAVVYITTSKLLKTCGVDDVTDACPVHFFCGAWGVVCAGLFASPGNYKAAHGSSFEGSEDYCGGVFYNGNFNQLSANLGLAVGVSVWAGATSLAVFCILYFCGALHAKAEEEESPDGSTRKA